jgi:integrase/recombinase XerD
MKPTKLSAFLESFFSLRLMKQKRVSPHTIASYSETFRLLFEYARKRLKKPPSQLTLQDINAQFLSQFLDDLEKKRKISSLTRNLRLTALRSFFRFLAPQLPEISTLISQVLAIPNKRSVRRLIDYLADDEVDALLKAPNQKKWVGKRDHALLLIAVQTGARLSELIELKWKDVHLGQGSYIECLGKGRKERCIPLAPQSNRCLQVWAKEVNHPSSDVVFPTIHGKKMSSDTFQNLVKKYTQMGAKNCPSLIGKKVTPHMLRHTTAMQLVQRGVDMPSIALLLGHESIKTTYIYLNADTEMKVKILKKLPILNTKTARYSPTDRTMHFLKNLTNWKDES